VNAKAVGMTYQVRHFVLVLVGRVTPKLSLYLHEGIGWWDYRLCERIKA
jgi:hypothetical protein